MNGHTSNEPEETNDPMWGGPVPVILQPDGSEPAKLICGTVNDGATYTPQANALGGVAYVLSDRNSNAVSLEPVGDDFYDAYNSEGKRTTISFLDPPHGESTFKVDALQEPTGPTV